MYMYIAIIYIMPSICILLLEVEGETECKVLTQLYLMCPDTDKKDVNIILVNDDNLILCLDLWKKSIVFDFNRAFQIMHKHGRSQALGILQLYVDFMWVDV